MTLPASLALLAATTAVVILLIARAPRPPACHAPRCPNRADTAVLVQHPAGPGQVWVCTRHADQQVFDVELDGTDLGAWQTEMDGS